MTGLAVLAAAAIIFRNELLNLLIINVGMHAGFRLKNLGPSAKTVCAAILLSLCVSVVIDSYFWGYRVLPEWAVFRFNILEKKSSNYGVLFTADNRHCRGIGILQTDC